MVQKIVTLFLMLLVAVSVYAQGQLASFYDKSGNHLVANLNPHTGSAHRVYGELPNISQFGFQKSALSKSSIQNLSHKFFDDYKNILKIDPVQVTLKQVETDGKMWFVSYSQSIDSVPVYGTEIGYTVNQNGDIISLGADAYQNVQVSTTPKIAREKALAVSKKVFAVDSIEVRNLGELMIYPLQKKDKTTFYLTWKVILFSLNPLKEIVYFVNASDGVIVDQFSNLRSAYNYGYVRRGYYPEHYYDTPVTAGNLQNVNVEIRGIGYLGGDYLIEEDNTSSSGFYQISWTPNYSYYSSFYIKGAKLLGLSNTYANIQSANTATHTHYFSPSSGYSHNWTWTTDETNVYYHMNGIHDFYTESPFSYSGMNYQMTAYLHDYDPIPFDNFNPPFNSWADGINIGFGTQSGEEWAKSSDVIYHEYTHNAIYHIYEGWIADIINLEDYMLESAAMGEGLPDYFATSINDDAVQGESVGVNRNLAEDKTMDDYWGDDQNEGWYSGVQYDNSLILSGACWDVRQEVGHTVADDLVFKSLQITPHAHTFGDFLDKMLLADREYYSGEHFGQINDAFANRGITGTYVSGTISSNRTWDGVYVVNRSVTVNNGATLTINPGSVVFFDNNNSLTVSGGADLDAEGTASLPIVLLLPHRIPVQATGKAFAYLMVAQIVRPH